MINTPSKRFISIKNWKLPFSVVWWFLATILIILVLVFGESGNFLSQVFAPPAKEPSFEKTLNPLEEETDRLDQDLEAMQSAAQSNQAEDKQARRSLKKITTQFYNLFLFQALKKRFEQGAPYTRHLTLLKKSLQKNNKNFSFSPLAQFSKTGLPQVKDYLLLTGSLMQKPGAPDRLLQPRTIFYKIKRFFLKFISIQRIKSNQNQLQIKLPLLLRAQQFDEALQLLKNCPQYSEAATLLQKEMLARTCFENLEILIFSTLEAESEL